MEQVNPEVHKKHRSYFFEPYELKYLIPLVKYFPSWLQTYHLTLCSIPWSIGVLASNYLSQFSVNWLWLTSLFVLLHFLTDRFDGVLGRYRETGLVKWGFYVDHFLDYIFLMSLMLSYNFALDPQYQIFHTWISVILGGFIFHSILKFATLSKHQIDFMGIGPTELRLVIIIVNTIIIFIGYRNFEQYLFYFAPILSIVLIAAVFVTHRTLWKVDMQNKKS